MIEKITEKSQPSDPDCTHATTAHNDQLAYTDSMKTNGNDKALESYKIFPYVAWIITFGFAVFVYNITVELQNVTKELQEQTIFLQDRIGIPPEEIEDFENNR